MALKFKKGAEVAQIVPIIHGTVLDSRIVDDDVSYLVEYVGADGEAHERWFAEAELEGVAK